MKKKQNSKIAVQNHLPTWDLADLFEGIDDPKLKSTVETQRNKAKAFAKKYRTKVATNLANPNSGIKMLQEFEGLLQGVVKPLLYTSLKFSESSSDPKIGAIHQSMKKEYSQTIESVIFFELEILSLEDRKLKALAHEKGYRAYRHYLTKLIKGKPHRRSEEVEKIVQDYNLTGRGAFVRMFEEETSRRKYSFKLSNAKKAQDFTQSAALNFLYSANPKDREIAAAGFTKGLKEDARRISFIFNTILEDKRISDKNFNYTTPEASRHLDNEIDQTMVDAMSDVVTKNYKLVQSFYEYKRTLLNKTLQNKTQLKKKELFDYDRYAPVSLSKKTYTWAEAQRLVLAAFYNFSSRFGEIAQEFFDKNWIDGAKREGKRGGAFCSGQTPDSHPYVFINFEGNIRDVFTLAHELGHAIHFYLMRDQSYLNFDTPLTLAETASIFSEMILFESLKSSITSKEEKRAMYVAKIESIFATVSRQISLYRFEQDVHKARREKGELSVEDFNKFWRARQEEMFKKSVTMTPGYDYWWGYIGHFIHTPFYVYAYAFGELLSLSLFAKYQKAGDDFIPKLTALLSAGGTAAPEDLLEPLGINLRAKEFWSGGIKYIEQLVGELKGI